MQKINNNNFFIKRKTYFIKKYSKDRKKSFERELYFYNFFKYNQNILIPKLLKKNKNISITFQYYPLKKIKSQKEYFKALFNFFCQTNHNSNKRYLKVSKEMHTSTKKIRENINSRILDIKEGQKNDIKLNIIINKLVKILPKKNSLKKFNSKKFQIISQSDIGIHNAGLIKKKILFFDFEYSGRDHIVKFLCDIYYQPELNVNRNIFKSFFKKVQKFIGIDLSSVIATYEPFYKVKMILIILKIFNAKNNFYNSTNHKILKIKKERLKKAYMYFNKKSIISLIK